MRRMAKEEGGSTLVGMGKKVDRGGRRWMAVVHRQRETEGEGVEEVEQGSRHRLH